MLSKKKKLILFVCLVMFLVLIGFGIPYILKYRPRNWDETKTIQVLLTKPSHNVFLRFGPSSENSQVNTTVFVYAEYSEFISTYKSDLTEEFRSNSIDNNLVSNITEQIDIYARTHAEIDISELQKFLLDPQLPVADFMYNDQLEYSLTGLINNGRVAVFDVAGRAFVPEIIYNDNGFICGYLCGERTKKYQLPNDKTFIYNKQIS